MKKRDILNSPRLLELKKHRRRIVLNKILFSVFVCLVLFIILVFISRLNKLNIFEIKITGNKIVDTELINDVVKNNLQGHYLYFFPRSNFLLLPKNTIKQELVSKFKRLKDISISLGEANTLAISVSEREGKYIYCGENLPSIIPSNEESPCYFVDESGYIFDLAPYFSGDVYFKFFGPEANSYFSPEIFEKIISFKNNIINMGIKPTSLYVKNDGDIEIYLSSNKLPPEAPKIIFKNNFDLDKLSENLRAAMFTEPLKSDFKNKYSSMQYIDLRFGNKVYFKF